MQKKSGLQAHGNNSPKLDFSGQVNRWQQEEII